MSDLKISNLDNLTTKILADAKEKADEIVKNAEVTEKGKYEAGIKKYNAKKVTLQESASRERELAVERIKSGANLKARNEKLEARQKVIDKVIEKLKEKGWSTDKMPLTLDELADAILEERGVNE